MEKISLESSFCEIHKINFLVCNFEGCKSKNVCKLCSINSKEGVSHLSDHFESITDLSKESENKINLKSEEIYELMNNSYSDYLSELEKKIEKIFSDVAEKKLVITAQATSFLNSKYEETTSNFEQLVKTLTSKIDSFSTADNKTKEEIKKIKSELDQSLNYMNDPKLQTAELVEFGSKLEGKLMEMKIKDLLENKFNFSKKVSNLCLDWESGSSILNVTARGNSYWCTRSKEILEGAFLCKVMIRVISNTNSYWNHTFGLIRLVTVNETSYYNDAVLLQSNGYLPTQFTGSGSDKQIFTNPWKNGDILMMRRDNVGNVFFAINDENNFIKAFDAIVGSFRIVMGFGSAMAGDVFEMIELTKE